MFFAPKQTTQTQGRQGLADGWRRDPVRVTWASEYCGQGIGGRIGLASPLRSAFVSTPLLIHVLARNVLFTQLPSLCNNPVAQPGSAAAT